MNATTPYLDIRAAQRQTFRRTLPVRIVFGLAATVIVALAAHVSLPLPFTPVPLTLQPLAVLGVALALGPVDAFFAMLAYLAEGAFGLPVFAPGPGGIAQLLGHSGGFLMAYPVVAFVAAAITRTLQRRISRFVAALVGCLAAEAVLFSAGAGWLVAAWHLSARQAFALAVVPFLLSDLARVVFAAGAYSAAGRFRRA